MLSLDPIEIMKEIRDAKEAWRPYLMKRAELIVAMGGPHYMDGGKGTKNPENYAFAYKSFVAPQLVYGEPVFKVRPAGPQFGDAAEAFELALEAWSRETDFKATVNALLEDAMVGFGFSKHGLSNEGRFHGAGLSAVEGSFEAVELFPFCVRIEPENAIIDSQAKRWDQVRIMGETYEQDVDDVLADWRNDPEATAKLAETAKEDQSDRTKATSAYQPRKSTAQRRRCVLHEVYFPEHGVLMTLGELGGDSAVILRQEQYYGPDEGPYVMWGLETIPGELLPCPPLMAMWDEHQEVQTHSRALAKSASTYKRLGMYEPSNKQDADRVKKADSGDLVATKNPKGIVDFEIGGASETQVGFVEYARNRFETNLGFGAAQQGIAAKDRTATGEQIAGQNSDLRVDRMRDRLAGSMGLVGRGVCWYFHHSQDIRPINTQTTDPMTGQVNPARIIPGPWEGGYVDNQWIEPEIESNFDTDYSFAIDPESLSKTDDALEQKRAQDELALVFQLLQVAPQFGYTVNLKGAIDRYGKKLGTPDLSSILLVEMQPGMGMPDPMATGQGAQLLGMNPGTKPNGQGAPPQSGPPSLPGQPPQSFGSPSPMGSMPSLPGMMGGLQRAAG